MTKSIYGDPSLTSSDVFELLESIDGNTPVILAIDNADDTYTPVQCGEIVKLKSGHYGGILAFLTAPSYSDDVLSAAALLDCGAYSYDIDNLTVTDILEICNRPSIDCSGLNWMVYDSASYAAELAQDPESDDFEPMGRSAHVNEVRYVQDESGARVEIHAYV